MTTYQDPDTPPAAEAKLAGIYVVEKGKPLATPAK